VMAAADAITTLRFQRNLVTGGQDGKPEKENWVLMRGIWISAATIARFAVAGSLMTQTLVLRGTLFREQEHRQERIGLGMTLWPTGPTRGEEANEIEIGNFNTL